MSFSSKKKQELVALCKERGLAVSGTKDELVSRLIGTAPSAATTKTTKTTTTSRKSTLTKEYSRAIVAARAGAPNYRVIKRNSFGNFEHPETHFVFDRNTKKVIGKQLEAEIVPLGAEDVQVCEQYAFEAELSCIQN